MFLIKTMYDNTFLHHYSKILPAREKKNDEMSLLAYFLATLNVFRVCFYKYQFPQKAKQF